jgi:acyl-CoA thioesterase I
MNYIIYHFISGQAFFSGICLIVLSCLLSLFRKKKGRNTFLRILVIAGAVFVFLSATPQPLWFYLAWMITFGIWLIFGYRKKHKTKQSPLIYHVLLIIFCLAATIIEIPFHLRKFCLEKKFNSLCIIGDSLSAGIGGKNERIWPRIIREKYQINVINLSQSGATSETAIEQAHKLKSLKALVLLEIGGNDLLRRVPVGEFENHLDMLIKSLSRPKHQLFMFELPLFPLCNEYGRIQRSVAMKYKVALIPKRFLSSILCAPGYTIDGIHLSPRGHKQMAETIWSLIGNCFACTSSSLSSVQKFPQSTDSRH